MPLGAPATFTTTPAPNHRGVDAQTSPGQRAQSSHDHPRRGRRSPSPATRPYRCFYAPLDRNGVPTNTDAGVLPFIDLKASNGEAAQRKAHLKTGCPVASVERLEHAE